MGSAIAAGDIQFNTDILDLNDRSNIDLSQFSRSGFILPGVYPMNVQINAQSLGEQRIAFIPPEDDPKGSEACLSPELVAQLGLKEGKDAVAQVEIIADEMGVPYEGAVVEGNPGSEIMRFAEEKGVDIIVMGTVGRTGLDKFLLGSVAEKVVRGSRIPVLTIPRGRT